MAIEKTTRHAALPPVRRGSILVLVLGILALMAVIAAVYVTIGLGDQRSSRAAEVRQEHDDIAPTVGDYIAGVIAADRTDINWTLGTDDLGLASQPQRETTDYPYTDFTALSIPELGDLTGRRVPPQQITHYRFRPSGGNPNPWYQIGNPQFDPRVPSDPFLASTEPTFLGDASERAVPGDPSKWWLDNHDWLQISNLAPDGMFVNLFSLRNNFDAARGFRSFDEMSYWLSLIGRDPSGVLYATEYLPWGDPADKNRPFYWTMYQRNMFFPIGQAFRFLDRNGAEAGWGSPDFPAYQYADADGDGFADSRWFELRDSTFIDRELNLLSNIDDYRIFMAARVVDLSARVNVNTATDSSIASTLKYPGGSGPVAVDLRRLLTMEDVTFNMTTTLPVANGTSLTYSSITRPSDWQSGANQFQPAADYSLYDDVALGGTGGNPTLTEMVGWYGYDGLRRAIQNETPKSNPDAYNTPAEVAGFWGGEGSIAPFDPQVELLPVSPFEYTLYMEQNESQLKLADMDFRAEMRELYNERIGQLDPTGRTHRLSGLDAPDTRFGSEIFGLADLSELLTYRGLNDPSTRSRLELAIDGRYDDGLPVSDFWQTTRRFGPMRSNRPLEVERAGHDDRTVGNEFAVGPQQSDGMTDDDAMALMALTPRDLLTTISGGSEIRNSGFLWNRDWRRQQPWQLPKPWYLPVSSGGNQSARQDPQYELGAGAIPLVHWVPKTGAANPGDQTLTWTEAKPNLQNILGSAPALFQLYRESLARYSSIDLAWTQDTASNDYLQYRTLFYGYGGPELAMRGAAHAAVNLKDQADGNSVPTVATLISTLSQSPNVDDPNQLPEDVDSNVSAILDNPLDFPGGDAAHRMMPPYAFADNQGLAESPALNVFGVEAQPFIVEAATITMYTDAPDYQPLPRNAPFYTEPNGDQDYPEDGCDDYLPPARPGMTRRPRPPLPVTIGGRLTESQWQAHNSTVWERNSDLVMQVFAVKLHNPFNVPVVLGQGASGPTPLSRNQDAGGADPLLGPTMFDFYIEFGGRYFKLARYEPPMPDTINTDDNRERGYTLSPVTLEPGETRVFYALAQEDEEEIVNRWKSYLEAYGYNVVPQYQAIEVMMRNWLNNQFGGNGMKAPVWMRRFDPETGLLINLNDPSDVDPDSEPSSRWGSWSPNWNQRMTFADLWEDPRIDVTYDDADRTTFPTAVPLDERRKPDWQVVRLWRKVVAAHDVAPDDGQADESVWLGNLIDDVGTDNRIENDLLADRLREPNPDANLYVNQTNYDPNAAGFYPDPTIRLGHLDSRLRFEGGYRDDGLSDASNPPRPYILRGGANTEGRCQSTEALITVVQPNGSVLTYLNDNTGLTIASHASMRRRGMGDNPQARGYLPQWCIETIQSWDTPAANPDYQGLGELVNLSRGYDVPSGPITMSELEGNATTARFTSRWFGPLVGVQTPEGEPVKSSPYQNTYNLPPEMWPAGIPADRDSLLNLLGDALHRSRSGAQPIGVNESLNPELNVANSGFTFDGADVTRVTDMLRPMAIGPEYDPFAPDGRDNDFNLRGRWLTLGEAFGLALGFEKDIEGVYSRYMYFDPYKRKLTDSDGTPASGEGEYVFDRLQLRLDAFVPFSNVADPDPTNFPGTFDPALGDRVLGEGVPLAMTLLDSVQTDDDGASNQVLRNPVFGKVNINTAPLRVLRAIGMLSPSEEWDPFGIPQNWMWRLASEYGGVGSSASLNPTAHINWAKTNLGLPDASRIDAAATVFAYRDRLGQIPFRLSSMPDSLVDEQYGTKPGNNDGPWNWGFTPYSPASNGAVRSEQSDVFAVTGDELRLIQNNRKYAQAVGDADSGRAAVTGIPAIRETPGFASLGEVLAARFGKDFYSTYPNGTNKARFEQWEANEAGIDVLGRDTEYGSGTPGGEERALAAFKNGTAGQEFTVRLESGAYTDDYLADELANDYDEQLALASQVLNVVTTRSDYFAVWFVLHGYTREDVSNLNGDVNNLNMQNADPLVPSFARRYVMVVDRSKVGTWEDQNGDQVLQESEIVTEPRIVLFREVPM